MFSINKKNRWFFLIIICMGMTGVFGVPYLTRSFYNVFQDAMGLTHSQIGVLMSIYGTLNLFLYFPGGWLADRVSIKTLLCFSFIFSGILGGIILMRSSFLVLSIAYAGFAVITSLTFFSTMLKFVRTLGDSDEQGALYGFKESLYGVFGVIIGIVVVKIGEVTGSDIAAYRWLVFLYSAISIVAGILLLVLLKSDYGKKDVLKKQSVNFEIIFKLLKMKNVWLITLSILSCYTVYCSLTYISPYLVEVFGASNDIASKLGLFRQYIAKIFMCFLFGKFADKKGSSVKVIEKSSYAILVFCIMFIGVPKKPSMLIPAIIVMVFLTLFTTGVRGVYFAQIDEAKLPLEYTGTILGIVSVVAFFPDAFYYTVMGNLIDKYIKLGNTAMGYQIVFGISAFFAVMAITTGKALYKSIYNKASTKK